MNVSLSSNLLAIHFCSQMSMSVAMATMFAMLIRTVTTQMVLTFVLARKDTLEMDSHVKVNKSSLHYLKQAPLHMNYYSIIQEKYFRPQNNMIYFLKFNTKNRL